MHRSYGAAAYKACRLAPSGEWEAEAAAAVAEEAAAAVGGDGDDGAAGEGGDEGGGSSGPMVQLRYKRIGFGSECRYRPDDEACSPKTPSGRPVGLLVYTHTLNLTAEDASALFPQSARHRGWAARIQAAGAHGSARPASASRMSARAGGGGRGAAHSHAKALPLD